MSKKQLIQDETKALIIELLDGKPTGGADLDGLLLCEEGFVMFEFLRCVTVRPFQSHPNNYWHYNTEKTGNKRKFLSLWRLAQKTNSRFFLINYEDNREQFKIIEVLAMNETQKIYEEKHEEMNFETFKKWLKDWHKKY